MSEPNIEILRGAIELGRDAIKSAILINGGAAIAVLPLVSVLLNNEIETAGIVSGLLVFGFGVFLATIAGGIAYITQTFYSQASFSFANNEHGQGTSKNKVGAGWNIAAVILIALSYLTFLIGMVVIYHGLV